MNPNLKSIDLHPGDENIQRLNDQLKKCKRNEETLQVQIKNVVYKTPTKGEKHWIIAQSESQLDWIPHLDDYIPICTSKLPVE